MASISIPFLHSKMCLMKVSREAMINQAVIDLESESLLHKKVILFNDLESDILLLFGVSKLDEKTREDVWDTIEEIRNAYPNVCIIFVKDKETFPIEIENEKGMSQVLGVFRSAGDPTPRKFDLVTLLFDKQFISKALDPIRTLSDAQRLKTFSKFELGIATCEADKNKKAFLKHLSYEDRFSAPHMSYFDFATCEKLNGNTDDLFLIKKHSELNTPTHIHPVEVDGATLNIARIPGFFLSYNSQNNNGRTNGSAENESAFDWKVQIARALNDMCIFTPSNFADMIPKNYSLWINVNLNRISQRQKKMIIQNAVETLNGLPTNIKDQIQVIFNPTYLNASIYRITVQNDYAIRQRSLFQKSKTKSEMSKIQAECPFDLSDRRNSYTYEFEPQLINWKADELIRFLQEVYQQNASPYYESQMPRPDHYSNKLVLDTFNETYFDKKDHVVLFYSTVDPNNLNLIRSYEQTVMQELAKRKYPRLRWHHMNADKNTSVPKTPVVAYFKKGQMLPFILQDPEATPEMVRQFIDATYHVEIDYNIYHL